MLSQSITILLAEDDDGHAHLVERNLRRAGLANDIVRVRDGREALDYVFREGQHSTRPSGQTLLLVLDINMPRVDGTEVLQRIKTTANTAKIPIIMLTTTDDPREINKCYEIGCSVYITKPVEYEAFVEAIRRLGLLLQIVRIPVVEQAHYHCEVARG